MFISPLPSHIYHTILTQTIAGCTFLHSSLTFFLLLEHGQIHIFNELKPRAWASYWRLCTVQQLSTTLSLFCLQTHSYSSALTSRCGNIDRCLDDRSCVATASLRLVTGGFDHNWYQINCHGALNFCVSHSLHSKCPFL